MGNKIRELRLELKMTQEELAKRAGVTRVTITNIENGSQNDIKVSSIKKIANALGVKISDLIEN